MQSAWPPANCRPWEGEVYWFKVRGSMVDIEQMVGGTRGTSYVYVEDVLGMLTNVRYLSGSRIIRREEWGRDRTMEVYEVPLDIISNRLVMRIDFTNSGYAFVTLCRLRGGSVECYLCPEKDVTREYVSRFRVLGGERTYVELYMRLVPNFVNDILSVARRSGAKDISFVGHAERIRETFDDPYSSLFTSMALNTAEGRVLSLQERLAHVFELWVLSKIVEAIDGETIRRDYWYIEFTRNVPFAFIKSRTLGKEFTIFYQPTIRPHVDAMTIEKIGEKVRMPIKRRGGRYHVIPDIVMFEGIIDVFLDWGMLHELVDSGKSPLLVVEVKTGVETSEWGRLEYVIEQLRHYRELLKPRYMALVTLMKIPGTSTFELKQLGADAFEDVINPEVQGLFKNYVNKVCMY